ncbi:hypothetical protein ACUSIJ_21140, partial [Pseudochelatococcus sp. B33]
FPPPPPPPPPPQLLQRRREGLGAGFDPSLQHLEAGIGHGAAQRPCRGLQSGAVGRGVERRHAESRRLAPQGGEQLVNGKLIRHMSHKR